MQDDVFTIDQNCHPLWDVVPKVHALARRGHRVRHFVEDVDVAFTAMGARAGDQPLHLARERFHRSGGADWGAAVFYFEFLGRQPVEIRDWEPLTGMKTAALARHLGRSVDELYDQFSPSDNWQLIGPSYVTRRDYHRIIGDLSAAEAADFLHEIIGHAEANMLATFPAAACRRRSRDWLTDQRLLFDLILADCSEGRLTDVYRRWLDESTGKLALSTSKGQVSLDLTSKLFACGGSPDQTALLELFTRQYDRAAAIYNRAIEQAQVPLHPLRSDEGELPFFVSFEHEGHKVRTGVFLREKHLRIGDLEFPLTADGGIPTAEMSRAGIAALSGKAVLLVIQARVGAAGRPLALPYRGSPYVPAAHRLAAELAAQGLLPGPLQPIVRVRLRFLDRLTAISEPIRLPEYLAAAFGQDEIPAAELGRNYADLAAEAAARLESFRTEAGRRQWQRDNLRDLLRRIDDLDSRRRKLAESAPPPEQIRGLWQQIKPLQVELLARTVDQIARDWQVRDLDFWDSRGAILPWAVALGGQAFYDSLIESAEIYEESAQ